VLVPYDTAVLSGTRTCTVTVNGLITRTEADSAYLRTITLPETVVSVDDTHYTVQPQWYQEARSRDELGKRTIVRYFEKTDTALFQRAYVSPNGTQRVPAAGHELVVPDTVLAGPFAQIADLVDPSQKLRNCWPASPLFDDPYHDAADQIAFAGQRVVSLALAPTGYTYTVNGVHYSMGIRLTSYYALSGAVVENGEALTIGGTVTVWSSYFRDQGLVDRTLNRVIQKTYSDGTVELAREWVTVARGPEGAPVYPEYARVAGN
jgi:hypothetical protein